MRSPNIAYEEKLDHIRLFAALWVLVFHSYSTLSQLLRGSGPDLHITPLTAFVANQMGPALFLTLSGFLFARIVHNKRIDIKEFYRNRLLRIYPLYLAATLLACSAIGGAAIFPLTDLLGSLLCLQAVVKGISGAKIDHLWTVAVEIQFYFIFPLLVLMFRKHGPKFLLSVMMLSIAGLAFVFLNNEHVQFVANTTLFGRINQLIVGMLIGFYYDSIKGVIGWMRIAFVPALIAMSFSLMWMGSMGGLLHSGNTPIWIVWPTLEGLCCGLAILGYVASPLKLPNQLSRLLAAGGTYTYSIYVVHGALTVPLMAWVAVLLRNQNHHAILGAIQQWLILHIHNTGLLAGLLILFPATLVVSILTFNVFEKPFMNMRRRYVFEDPDLVPPVSPPGKDEVRALSFAGR